MNHLYAAVGAACVVWVMERFVRYVGLRCGWLGAFFLCTTWLFFDTVFLEARVWETWTVVFQLLSLFTFFRVYADRTSLRAALQRRRGISSNGACALLPLWLFLAMLCGGVAGVLAPLGGIGGFMLVNKRSLRDWKIWWREVLIFSALCLTWLYFRWNGDAIFHPAPREHLFWYFPRLMRDLLPWTPVYLIIIAIGVFRGKLRSDGAKFMGAGIVAIVCIMSLSASKSTVYLLPVYPLLSYLTAALFKKQFR